MEEAETTKTVDPFTDGLELIGNGGQASNNYYEDKGFHDGEKNGQAEAYRNGYKFGYVSSSSLMYSPYQLYYSLNNVIYDPWISSFFLFSVLCIEHFKDGISVPN